MSQNALPSDFNDVRRHEAEWIKQARRDAKGPDNADDLWGLALSGGGIRSATFNLGILQGLCKAALLSRFDYLSTVSGGGFIGGWLTSHVRRAFNGDIHSFESALAGFGLNQALFHLLRFRNYLLGPDANATYEGWKRGVLYAGSVVVNVILLIAVLLALLLAARVVVTAVDAASIGRPSWLPFALILPALAVVIPALAGGALDRRFVFRSAVRLLRVVLWAVGVASLVGTTAAVRWSNGQASAVWTTFFAGFVAYALSMGLYTALLPLQGRTPWLETIVGVALTIVPAAVFGGLIAGAVAWLPAGVTAYLVVVPGLSAGLLAMALTVVFHLQIAGDSFSERFRARVEELPPMLTLAALAWVVLTGVAIYAPLVVLLFLTSGAPAQGTAIAVLAFAALLLVVLLVRGRAQILTGALIAGFALILGCVVSYGARQLLVAMDDTLATATAAGVLPAMVETLARPAWPPLIRVSLASLLALLVLLLLFDVNTTSLLRLYRAALARCFLQVYAEADADGDPDIRLSAIPPTQRPYHLANATANAWSLLGGTISFTFSPGFCGLHGRSGGFRRTTIMAGDRLSLGTVLAVSGAAVSPNARGFGGGLGLILGLANARLGQWLGNPTHADAWNRQAPRFGGLYWFRELLGRKRADAPYLYLTDGGHFENLGIYELVARGCRLILAIDAGCDPLWAFEDLANAIRKCALDFGVDIRLADDELIKMRHNYRVDRSWAVGRIYYPDGTTGVLVYVKPSLSASVPIDVTSYGILNPSFPHESTADQFFDDAQFESYRRLGLHICFTALNSEDVQQALAYGAGGFPVPKFEDRINA